MTDEIEDIKQRLDIVEFISSYITLKKAGANYKGLCPFHNEKTPSLMVSAEKQIFKCFGCNEGGDIFSFLMKTEGLSFGDALKTLADKAGVKLKPRSFESLKSGEQPGQKTRLYELNDLAARLYHKLLLEHPSGKTALNYLEKRGVSKETIKKFNLGYSPASWDLLIRFAESRGFSEKELLVAGLSVRKTQNISSNKRLSYDRFRERLIFPINNILGQTVAFTGRLLKDKAEAPKYLNSSESPVYRKSQTIYGLDKAKLSIKQADLVVVVEGNMDVVSCHQAGFENVVAVSGTALTKEMLQILSRYTFNIAFSFDSDQAGQLALKRAIGLAGELDLNSKVVNLPDKFKDPDEAIKDNPENWQKAVNNAQPALEFLINRLSATAADIGQKKQVIKEILPTIKLLKSHTERDHFIKMLASRLVVSAQSIAESLQNPAVETSNHFSSERNVKISNEIKLLSILNEKSDQLKDELKLLLPALKTSTGLPESWRQKIKDFTPNDLVNWLKTAKLNLKLKEVYLEITKDLENEVTDIDIFKDLMNQIKNRHYEDQKNELVAAIAKASSGGDKKMQLELLKKLNSVIMNNRE